MVRIAVAPCREPKWPREPLNKSRSPSAPLFAGGAGVAAKGRRPAEQGHSTVRAPRGALREGLKGALAVLRLIVWDLPHGFAAPCHHAL